MTKMSLQEFLLQTRSSVHIVQVKPLLATVCAYTFSGIDSRLDYTGVCVFTLDFKKKFTRISSNLLQLHQFIVLVGCGVSQDQLSQIRNNSLIENDLKASKQAMKKEAKMLLLGIPYPCFNSFYKGPESLASLRY